MDDLEQAIRYALEPLTNQGGWEMCAFCGAAFRAGLSHSCRTRVLDIPGMEHDAKRRAKSYAIE